MGSTQRIVVKTCVDPQNNRMISWITVFGEQAGEDEIENIDDFGGQFYAYLVSFTTDAANRIGRNSGEGNGSEAWRRLHSEYDPTSSMRLVAILQQFQNPLRCQRVEDLGTALEDWLSKKTSTRDVHQQERSPCQASDDSLMATMFRLMPKSFEETVKFANEDEGFEELCDRLLAYSSTKQSIQLSEKKKSTKKDDPMDVDAMDKGAGKGKPINAKTSNCDEQADGWIWKGSNKLMGGLQRTTGGKRTTSRQERFGMVDDRKQLHTLGTRRSGSSWVLLFGKFS